DSARILGPAGAEGEPADRAVHQAACRETEPGHCFEWLHDTAPTCSREANGKARGPFHPRTESVRIQTRSADPRDGFSSTAMICRSASPTFSTQWGASGGSHKASPGAGRAARLR